MAKSDLTTEVERLKKEFYQGMAELRESQKRGEESQAELRESQKKTDEQLKKTDEQLKKTDEQINKLRTSVKAVSDGYGRFVEGIVSPSAERYFQDVGYKVGDTFHRIKIKKDGEVIAEYDTLIESYLAGKEYLLIGEAKTYCTSEDVRDFLKQIKKIHQKEKYKDKTVIGFVAAVNYNKGVENKVVREGLYFFKITDDVMEVQVPEDFRPKKF